MSVEKGLIRAQIERLDNWGVSVPGSKSEEEHEMMPRVPLWKVKAFHKESHSGGIDLRGHSQCGASTSINGDVPSHRSVAFYCKGLVSILGSAGRMVFSDYPNSHHRVSECSEVVCKQVPWLCLIKLYLEEQVESWIWLPGPSLSLPW